MTEMINKLYATIKDRQANPKDGSYTTSLFEKGIDEISKKVGEEAVEVIVAAHNQSRERLLSELADLTYHALVLMALMDVKPEDVGEVLAQRHK